MVLVLFGIKLCKFMIKFARTSSFASTVYEYCFSIVSHFESILVLRSNSKVIHVLVFQPCDDGVSRWDSFTSEIGTTLTFTDQSL